MRKGIRSIKVLVAIAVIAGLMGMAPAATAKQAAVTKRGACSMSSDWKLKVAPDNARLEVEFEVDSNHVGQTWSVRLFHNGIRIFAGSRVTQPPSGSFTVRRLTANLAGTDKFRGRAVNAATGEVCVGTVSFAG
jgi:hypothetical protein